MFSGTSRLVSVFGVLSTSLCRDVRGKPSCSRSLCLEACEPPVKCGFKHSPSTKHVKNCFKLGVPSRGSVLYLMMRSDIARAEIWARSIPVAAATRSGRILERVTSRHGREYIGYAIFTPVGTNIVLSRLRDIDFSVIGVVPSLTL